MLRQILTVYIGYTIPLVCTTGVLWHIRQFFTAQFWSDRFFVIQRCCNYPWLLIARQIDADPDFFDIFSTDVKRFGQTRSFIIFRPCSFISTRFGYISS